MKIRNWLSGWFAVSVLFLYGCSKPTATTSDALSVSSMAGIQETEIETEDTSFPTSVPVDTSVAGQTATDRAGQIVTTVGTEHVSSVPNTVSTAGYSSDSDSSRHTTPNRTTMETTMAQGESITTSTGVHTVKPTDPPTTQVVSSSHKPVTTTTTSENPVGPWWAPYDLSAIYADCKQEIERLGMTWEEGLRPDSLGVSWDNPENTVVYTYFPEDFSLRDYIFNELIPFYKNQSYTRQSCRIWFEPYNESPGDYLIYFLERR